MTPLEYIESNPTLEEARTRGLVFSAADKDSMLALLPEAEPML